MVYTESALYLLYYKAAAQQNVNTSYNPGTAIDKQRPSMSETLQVLSLSGAMPAYCPSLCGPNLKKEVFQDLHTFSLYFSVIAAYRSWLHRAT